MGSKSDWETMRHADEMLQLFGVPHECRVVSAHRTPVLMAEYASAAEGRGIEVIIAGAGGAAHLPGMVAAHTVAAGARRPGREPRAQGPRLAAVDRADAGRRAGGHAGHRRRAAPPTPACSRSRSSRTTTRRCASGCAPSARSRNRRSAGTRCRDRADPSGRDDRRARRRPARPHVRDGGARAWAIASTRSRPTTTRRPARWPTSRSPPSYDDLDAIRAFARNVDVVTFEFENVSAAAAAVAGEHAPVRPSGHVLHITQQRAREKGFLADRGFPGDAVCAPPIRAAIWRTPSARSARRRC